MGNAFIEWNYTNKLLTFSGRLGLSGNLMSKSRRSKKFTYNEWFNFFNSFLLSKWIGINLLMPWLSNVLIISSLLYVVPNMEYVSWAVKHVPIKLILMKTELTILLTCWRPWSSVPFQVLIRIQTRVLRWRKRQAHYLCSFLLVVGHFINSIYLLFQDKFIGSKEMAVFWNFLETWRKQMDLFHWLAFLLKSHSILEQLKNRHATTAFFLNL